ncbi:hypothetical protein VPHK165_0021 [Vibrio phage K165]|nr:hypothetical protein MYOV022v2_p0016 [Vibrio phage 12E28.1]QZI90185.1 hypothetical protein MYOV021v2_p0016 [Vibrio phage 18E29.1]QZI90550.1 hypothetical protein MYOV023v1_p0003 [Vibrio phage 91E28.1a]QZI90700.1 hypothetical protein MYOV020v1_p0074 [Vibrio phage 98E28.6a]
MNYEEMSYFEINKRVGMYLGRSVSAEHECIKTGSCLLLTSKAFERIEFNPCNNPSDAWPIIVENKIGVVHNWNEEGMWTAIAPMSGVSCDCNGRNPLRAAMICFLKMKDAEQ